VKSFEMLYLQNIKKVSKDFEGAPGAPQGEDQALNHNLMMLPPPPSKSSENTFSFIGQPHAIDKKILNTEVLY